MQVLKFGGSSVANAENIKKVIAVIRDKSKDEKTVTVVSALGGITDLLLHCSELAAAGNEIYKDRIREIEQRHLQAVRDLILVTNQSSVLSFVKTQCNEMEDILNGIFLLKELSARTKDRIVSYGELLSSKIISAALNTTNTPVQWIDARELIVTDSNFGNAVVDFETTNQNISAYFQESTAGLFLVPGFIAANKEGIQTTLGRGGSDYTAAIFAAALDVQVLEIWTDVSGMMTADPRLVSTAKIIPQISYQEAMELSHFGAKVIYPPTIQPVMNKGISVWIKNTFAPGDEGTVIRQLLDTKEDSAITGISSVNKIALISLEGSGMIGIPGFSRRLFAALASEKINVILITQSSSEHSICVGISEDNSVIAKRVIDTAFEYEIASKKVEPLIVENNLSIVALVGDRMKNHTGISGRLFNALGKNGINVRAISQGSSERNISTVISSNDVKKAINVIHEAFFETGLKEVNVFLAGVGNVGTKLLTQINKQQSYLLNKLKLKLKIVGVANSKKFAMNEDGIDLSKWQDALNEGQSGSTSDYIDVIKSKNLRNMVFADVTANETVAACYDSLLEKTIAVVACNKIACSSPYPYYKKIKDLATEYNAHFLFETNVGASLPIIGTLNDLMRSGDTVHRMQAVLSGTLNFVFNNYDGRKSFASVVKQAQEEGYTEPDPRLDLGGKDVMRKIMILARESGEEMEMEDIENNSFMPEECMQGSVEDFYASMEKHEAHFKKIFDEAHAAGCKLKFVASYNNGKASVGLQHIDPQHDFYHLYGKDNIVLFYTDRYVDQPLVVKGAGAGADVTASGIFADIIRASKS
ncbi:bifunctional aspartate kinase/homoserine dehydrogenase I [Ferruginibacter sp. HRS2-29]|uniref:bifunctional aspartate kinase/homoserine dehydrogenase I n=1 Tax=Ferruginibacter sp. HRS2-29 TaxID=2487334 RepID=UPI0020CBFD47|nr:bifunctional aspartate kinase/homoserine dehydrogenase I [Ferruginibacter sp. HRS2-29]MCP9751755.1 bifunctional aspartate kinase/homoserine dehydrogenase I [Ferruginibacter sp. HRS2-29]